MSLTSQLRACNEPMIVISTSHLSEHDCERLGDSNPDYENAEIRILEHEYGFILTGFLHEDETDEEYANHLVSRGFTREFADLVNLLKLHGAQWINFDIDGPEIDELPTYEW